MEPRVARRGRANPPPPPGRLRRRLRTARGRGSVFRRWPRPGARSRTCLRAWSRSRWSLPTTASATAATGCWRRSASTRATGSRQPAKRRPAPGLTPPGRSSWPSEGARMRGSTGTRRTSEAALDMLLAVDPHEALRLCVALWPFWLRRIDLEEGHRRLEEALAAVPERTETREAALLAASALDLRAGRPTAPRRQWSSAGRSPRRSAIHGRTGSRSTSPAALRSRGTTPPPPSTTSKQRAGPRAARRLCRSGGTGRVFARRRALATGRPRGRRTSRRGEHRRVRAARRQHRADPDAGQRRRHAPGRVRARAAKGVRGHPPAVRAGPCARPPSVTSLPTRRRSRGSAATRTDRGSCWTRASRSSDARETGAGNPTL